jgi:four helix bundle protein
MDERELKERTKAFALRVLKVVEALPKTIPGKAVADQLIRSGTSVAANYRAACICRSKAEFTAKLGVVLEETDESCYWLEFIAEGALLPAERVTDLRTEGEELRAIFIASIRSAKGLAPPVQQSPISNQKSTISNSQSAPVCAECGKPMARRTAKSGKNAGKEFWGCTGYPECKGVREVEGGGR